MRQLARKRKIYVRSDAPTLCTCGQVIANRKGVHFRSTLHLQYERIRALLARDCISLAEIARRVGVSRQRVHQLAKNIFGVQGQIRRKACRLRRAAGAGGGRQLTLAREALQQARAAGLEAELIRVPKLAQPWAVSIRGRMCLLRTAVHVRPDAGESRRSTVHVSRIVRAFADFVLIRIDAGNWMVLPREKFPRRGTSFSWPLRHPEMGAKRFRHDWRCYVNAWHLLKA